MLVADTFPLNVNFFACQERETELERGKSVRMLAHCYMPRFTASKHDTHEIPAECKRWDVTV